MDFTFRVLGPLEVNCWGKAIRFRGPKQRALLAALLLRANRVADMDYLVDMLWGESVPASARVTLHSHVMRVRTAITSGVVCRRYAMERIVTHASGYQLTVKPGELDLHSFDTEVASAVVAQDRRDFAEAAMRYRRALTLWQGAPLADVPSDRLERVEVPELEQRRLTVLQDCVEVELRLGLHARLIAELRRLVRLHPYQERLTEQLMLALYRSGQQVDALRAYQETAWLLDTEFGLEPGPGLQRLRRRILNHDQLAQVAG